jgi:modulator of FtsH protease HflC
MMRNLSTVAVLLLVALVLLSLSVFTVEQTKNAIVFQLGEVVAVKTTPGLNFKLPLVQNVRNFDARIQTLDAKEPGRFITSEKKPVLVDYFVKWRIFDVKKFYVTVGGDETRAQIRLAQTVNDDLRAEFARRTVHDAISGARDQIMESMRRKADADARTIGVEVLDVRIKRVDLTPEVSESVYGRMVAERKRVANQLRSTGFGESEKIRADADKQREIILAEAFREAQQTKGGGDAKAAAIYAAAFGQNAEFYAFYRSLETYQKSFRNKGDLFLLDANSDFFKYLKSGPRPK